MCFSDTDCVMRTEPFAREGVTFYSEVKYSSRVETGLFFFGQWCWSMQKKKLHFYGGCVTVQLCWCVFGIGTRVPDYKTHYKMCCKGQESLSESLPNQCKNYPIDVSLYPQRTSLLCYLFITPFNLFHWTLQQQQKNQMAEWLEAVENLAWGCSDRVCRNILVSWLFGEWVIGCFLAPKFWRTPARAAVALSNVWYTPHTK